MKKEYVYIVIQTGNIPKIRGVFRNKKDAEEEAYKDSSCWCNIKKEELK